MLSALQNFFCLPGRHRGLIRLALILNFITPSDRLQADDPLEQLLKKVPASANALMLIDAESLMKTPYAIQKGWGSKSPTHYQTSPLSIPPEAKQIVIAAQMNPNIEFAQAYEIGLVALAEPLSMRSIARAEGGYVDVIGSTEAVWSPAGAYFFELDKSTIAIMSPPHRQAVARWSAQAKQNDQLLISPYLQGARLLCDEQTQIVMAFDLEDSVQPHTLQEALANSAYVGDDTESQQKWMQTIFGLKGLTFSVDISDQATGTLIIDFEGIVDVFGQQSKTIVLEALRKYGVSLEEFQSWKVNTSSHTIELSGELSDSGMRKIFSLLEIPSTNFSRLKEESPAAETETDKIGQASLKYFQSITTLLDDLQTEMRTNRDARGSNAPVYLERYGRKIDRLPILNVDPQLLNYGSIVAETLRSASVTSRTAGVNTGIRKSSVYGNYDYSYNGSGYSYGNNLNSAATKQNVKTQIEREEKGEARIQRFSSGKEIADATAAIRQQMTQKYQLEF